MVVSFEIKHKTHEPTSARTKKLTNLKHKNLKLTSVRTKKLKNLKT